MGQSNLNHRREFLAASAAAASTLAFAPNVHAGGTETLKVGLIGCGGRGIGAAVQACQAGPGITLTALGDVFADRLRDSQPTLRRELGDRYQVKPEHCFTGFDAYKAVLDSGVDVVCLTTPPHFRPLHLEAAVAASKHVFCEKPVAVDAPGYRRVLAAAELARKKNLCIVAGFCWRYHGVVREAMQRIHDGQIGRVLAVQNCYNTGPLWHQAREPAWSDMEWQLRNWLYFTWLSGDHLVEQAVHNIDKLHWALGNQPPLKAMGVGGRQVRTGPEFGHIYDHFAINYEFPQGVRAFHLCRQMAGTANNVSDHIIGEKGICHITGSGSARIEGDRPWQADPKKVRSEDMYQNEHNELFAAIRNGKPINDGEWMARSSMIAIHGRMAAYTGRVISWEEACQSREDLTPEKYEFGALPVPPVAMPGKTRFV